MSHRSIITTTSFIVSSNESLNKPPLSSGSDSVENMTTTSDLSNNYQSYSGVTLNPLESATTFNKLHEQNMISQNTQPFAIQASSTALPQESIYNNSPSTQTFQQKHSPTNQRSSTSSLDSASSTPLMPINVKGMLLHGLPSGEVMRHWLLSIKCDEYLKNFVEHGYDIHSVIKMTPQDLAAIGCKSPVQRKKLLMEIKKLNIEDDVPDFVPPSLDKWLELLRLKEYHHRLITEGYDSVDKVCQLTWEDLEEIGISKLGHQKRLLLGIDRIKKLSRQEEERQNDLAIYDVHPNHRVALNNTVGRSHTLHRVRSGLFQTRSSANVDHRGLPVATVMPALKHVHSPILNGTVHRNTLNNTNGCFNEPQANSNQNGLNSRHSIGGQPLYESNGIYSSNINQELALKMSDLSVTLQRNPPPLPPVRTNSLKNPQVNPTSFNGKQINHSNGISLTKNSTSFLRTPKLGTLTATTNKMLTLGGHIQTVSGCAPTVRPIREAPLPPVQLPQPPPVIPESVEEEASASHSTPGQFVREDQFQTMESSSLIDHQLASADEFPPPPPCQ